MGVAEVINIKSNNLNLIMAVNSKWSREIVALQNHLSNIEENCSLTNYTAFVTAVKKAHDESKWKSGILKLFIILCIYT